MVACIASASRRAILCSAIGLGDGIALVFRPNRGTFHALGRHFGNRIRTVADITNGSTARLLCSFSSPHRWRALMTSPAVSMLAAGRRPVERHLQR